MPVSGVSRVGLEQVVPQVGAMLRKPNRTRNVTVLGSSQAGFNAIQCFCLDPFPRSVEMDSYNLAFLMYIEP